MRATWTPIAVSHLKAAYDYIAADNPTAAETVLERIFSAVEFLERRSNIGRPGRVAGTRELVIPHSPFIVAYRSHRKGVEILAVLHGARKWPENFQVG